MPIRHALGAVTGFSLAHTLCLLLNSGYFASFRVSRTGVSSKEMFATNAVLY